MPDAFVVDTSVFVRWFLEQVGYEHAREVRARFLAGALLLETVDCVRFELGHVLRTRSLLLGRLDGKEYVAATRAIDDLGVAVQITGVDALESAAELAWRATSGSSTRCWCTARWSEGSRCSPATGSSPPPSEHLLPSSSCGTSRDRGRGLGLSAVHHRRAGALDRRRLRRRGGPRMAPDRRCESARNSSSRRGVRTE